jgi:hypothetical protein
MNQMQAETRDVSSRSLPGCNVNSTFNFTVGAFAVLAGALIVYFIYSYWWK